jgi:hypothetical protein
MERPYFDHTHPVMLSITHLSGPVPVGGKHVPIITGL